MVAENHRNFQRINSYLFIGFDKIRKIVFHSISLNSSCVPVNSTHTSPKTSIIASPKSTIILSSSPIVSFQRTIENMIKIKAKKSMR
jgi:hypothetical protein